jgi:hypothetical protein
MAPILCEEMALAQTASTSALAATNASSMFVSAEDGWHGLWI